MKKLKIYIDTSVISHLLHEDAPGKMQDTVKLWELIKNSEYVVCLSTVTLEEIDKCREPKRSSLLSYLGDIDFHTFEITEDTQGIANEIISQGILTEKSRDDCLHIAAAILGDCDIIVSWNFKHMVNVKTINGIRAISLKTRYKTIDIYPPSILIKGDDDNE